jgi:hypothetical protein
LSPKIASSAVNDEEMEEIFVLEGRDIGDFDGDEDGEDPRRDGEFDLVSGFERHSATGR